MNLEKNILFNLPKIKKLENNIYISNRKIKNIIDDIIYFYEPNQIIIEKNKIIFFINNIEIIIFSNY